MELTTTESALSTWHVQKACERLILEYTHRIDSGEAERVADLFAPDGIWEAYRNRKVGQQEIREAFRHRQENQARVSRHVCTNIAIDILGPRQAAGLTYFILFREDWGTGKDFVPF